MRLGHIPRVEACDPSPTGGGEVEEDCTMASPECVCRAVCEGVRSLGGRFLSNTHLLPPAYSCPPSLLSFNRIISYLPQPHMFNLLYNNI